MAKNTSQIGTRRFDKELNEDVNDFHLPDNSWTHARNAINNSITGDLGKLGNEPSTKSCIIIKYTNCSNTLDPHIIGTIHVIADTWVIFSTNGTCHEIGLFTESLCKYETIVNDQCLNFSLAHLIKGVSRPVVTCTHRVYWDDGLNPTRVLTFDVENPENNKPFLPLPAPPNTTNPNSPIPWVQVCKDSNNNPYPNPNPPPGYNPGCITCDNTTALDCNKIRLATFIDTPCVEVQNGFGSGTLLNGSYMVAIAYAIDGLKISDWYISNVQALFDHNNASCSLDVILNDLDTRFDEIQVALISIVNQQTVARYAGIYSTRQKRLSFDTIDNTWPSIPIEQIPVMTPIVEKTDATYTIGSYLVRTGPTSKLNFNYQPLANQIVTKWQSIRYPHDYYRKGGNKTNYLRDEVYSFFIRWVYDTGDKSSSYHIPGRSIFANEDTQLPQYTANDALPVEVSGGFANRWVVQNTATFENPLNIILPDGGVVTAEGLMGYWESTEKYPDNKPEVWNSVNNPLGPAFNTTINPYSNFNPSAVLTDLDLCGKQIRHHRFPDLYIHDRNQSLTWNPTPISQLEYSQVISNQRYINILGVAFNNIKLPIDLNGNPIPGIVGYEILRGTRNGNKTILAKGLIKNLREYTIPNTVGTNISSSTNRKNLFINYPYNDRGPDKFLSSTPVSPLQGLPKDDQNDPSTTLLNTFEETVISFHSPDTNFTEPFLSPKEIKIHGEFRGGITGKFEFSEKHPQEKLISNTAFVMSAIAGIGIAVVAASGKRSINYISPKTPGFSEENIARRTDNKTDYDLKEDYSLDYSMAEIYFTPYLPYFPPFSAYTLADSTITGYTDTSGYIQGYNQVYYDGNQYDLVQTSPTYVDRQYIKGTGGNDPAALIFLKFFSDPGITSTAYNDTRATKTITDITVNPVPKSETSQIVDFTDTGITESKDHPAMGSGGIDIIKEDGALDNIPGVLKVFNKFPLWLNYFTQGTDTILNLIRAALPYQDYALRYHSHCFYDTYTPPVIGNQRRDIIDIAYVGPDITNFSTNYRINNLYRSKAVVLSTPVSFSAPTYQDISRIKASDVFDLYEPEFANYNTNFLNVIKNPTKLTFGQGFKPSTELLNFIFQFYKPDPNGLYPLPNTASSHYGSLKQRLRNQYGQITGINQVPVTTCTITIDKTRGNIPYKSGTLFGGDTYVGRYTEKNTFFYFYNWLYGEPDGAQFDYTKNQMIPYPIYWANFDGFKTSDFMSSFSQWITSLGTGTSLILPSDFYNLDKASQGISIPINFFRPYIKYSYFYLFNSGVLDFYTESEINLDLRDWGTLDTERHYDPWRYDDTKVLFNTGIIKTTNYYKYDFSLSYAKLFLNYISWASAQRLNYDPFLAENCYVYSPNKIIYSLPNQYESLRDNWSIFLANNYKDFENKVTCIKPVNKSGAIIFFDASSPVMFQGTDTLETGLGTKLVIGDGGLFAQPLQNIVNADAPYEYASCQDRLSVINTPLGIYWISQNQGKIFSYTNGLNELSMSDIKWWLTLYLPYKIVEQFPKFSLIDNPVFGVGTQSIYDNQNGLIYFTKKDYSLRTDLPPSISVKYVSENEFDIYLNNILSTTIFLGDNTIINNTTGVPIWKDYFEDASWTISYDPKTGSWISYHDWHPDLVIPGKNTFLSTKNNSIWIHNIEFLSYNNYYGINYPFEVEYVVNTIQTITTLRSIEYQLECYKYDANGFDRFHILDFNFDKAVIYNTEQVSGYLRLILDPKNNLSKLLNYPIVGANIIDILYSKEENKYRFNQFWDITDDRGENNPSAQRMIWNTAANGYDRTLNTANLNYAKDVFQLKKFRHYTNTVWLRKDPANDPNIYPTGSNPYKMLVILTNNKELYSPR